MIQSLIFYSNTTTVLFKNNLLLSTFPFNILVPSTFSILQNSWDIIILVEVKGVNMTELRQTRLSLQQIQRIWLLWKSIWWVQYCKVHALNRKFPMDLLLTDQTITQPAANIWMMHELRQQINSHDSALSEHFYYYLKSHLNTVFKIINKLILNFRKKEH